MPNHTITNVTTSMLDMSPLCDLLGQRLTLRSQESRDVDDKTFNDDIVQRVILAKWLAVKPQSVASAPEATLDVPEISTSAAPPEAPVDVPPEAPAVETSTEPETAPVPEAEPVGAPEIPVETPVVSEKPLVEIAPQSSGKANKRR